MRWRKQAGEDFTFTLKGTRYVTHLKRLKEIEDSLERFFTAAAGLGESLSCVLWQFPRNFTYKEETVRRLETFLKLLPTSIRQALEFRHTSWFTEAVFALLDRCSIGYVINDSPHFPEFEKNTGGFVYIRFHGPGALYASKYSEKQMAEWARKIKEYQKHYDVYCYFNNDYYGYAIDNAKLLRSLLE